MQTQGHASIRVATYAATLDDPLLREAVTMNANEEACHKVVLSRLVQAYGIKLAPEPPYPAPADALRAWMLPGHSECLRTGDPERSTPHSLFCQLGGVVSTQPAVLSTPGIFSQDVRRVDIADS